MTRDRKRSRDSAHLSDFQVQNVKVPRVQTKGELQKPLSLLDCCAKAVASKIPFQQIEDTFTRIPEPVQLRIVYWSFPCDEHEIQRYSSLNSPATTQHHKTPFLQGLKLLENKAVSSVLQVGFHLSGCVHDDVAGENLKISINFDRCKITSVSCSCGSRDILWCSHVVALSLYRIRHPNAVTLRVPISETLLQMDRNQLQKLVQYLITEHHSEVLPTAQRLADEILLAKSEINLLQGAPDPTAGGALEDESRWHLDAEQVQEQVKAYLSQGGFTNNGKQLHSMFAKVRELLRVQDSNGPRMLTLITEQFLADPRLQQNVCMTEKCRQLWNHLGALWMCIVLNPSCQPSGKESWRKQLQQWSDLDVCPLNDEDCLGECNGKQTVFSGAIAACELNWESGVLQKILKGEADGVSWLENVCISAARIDALKTHGFPAEAHRLAVAVAHGMKQKQDENLQEIQEQGLSNQRVGFGWIGNVLEPISTLYDALIETTGDNEDQVDRIGSGKDISPKPCVSLALDVALIGLSQHRRMPKSSYGQQKASSEEEQLIAQLNTLKLDRTAIDTLLEQARKILQMRSSCGTGLTVDQSSVPLQTFARYLFNILLPEDRELAFNVGISALQSDFMRHDNLYETGTEWHTFGHLQAQQSELAACMIQACKDNKERLRAILVLVKKHIHNPSHLFRLAQDILKLKSDKKDRDFGESALGLGLHLLSSTLNKSNCKRREVIQWLFACSLQLDKSVLISIMQNWQSLFTPTEVATCVVPIVMSQNASLELELNQTERETLRAYAQALVIQCVRKDPQSCALSALTLCENEPKTFETAYRIIVESAGSITSTHLFAIARYMDHKNYPSKAFQLALLAMKQSSVAHNDSHPSVGDVHWSCGLAHALGKIELAHMITLIVNSVQCPSVLSDLLHRCTLTPVGVARTSNGSVAPARLMYDDPCLQPLVEAAINAYVNCAHNRLNQISPKHYTDFIDFLLKAKETFLLAKDGGKRFNALIDNMKVLYRGKKKLMNLLKGRLC